VTADLDKAVRSAVWITAASLAATVSGVFFWAAAAALAGKEGLGAAAYEIAAANTAAALLNLGLQQYTLRFVKTERGKALATALLAAALLAAAGAAALYAAGMRWAPLIAASSLLSAPSTGALIAADASQAYFVSTAVASAAKIGLLAAMPPAAAFAAATAITAVLTTAYALWRVGLDRPGDWGTFLAAGASNYALNFSFSLATSLGVVIAGTVGGVEQVGVLYLVATAAMALAAASLATAVYNVERRWGSIAAVGLAGTASTAVAVALVGEVGPAGPGLAITLGLVPPFLLSLRAVPRKPFLASLAAVAALGPAALYSGPLGTAAAVLASVAAMHLAGVFKAGDYAALARAVLRR